MAGNRETAGIWPDNARTVLVVTVVVYKKVVPLIDSAKGVLDAAQGTMNDVQGTAAFVSETAVSPLIRFVGFVSGVKAAGERLAAMGKKKEGSQ